MHWRQQTDHCVPTANPRATMSLDARIQTLRGLVRLINDASAVVIQEWQAEAKDPNPPADASLLPSPALYDARRTLVGACGMAADLVAEPKQRLMEIASS